MQILDLSALNWWAVLVATVLAFVIGGLWYGPLFGRPWMNAMGFSEEDIEPSATPFIVSFLTAGITAIVLAWLIQVLGVVGWGQGALLGGLMGVGFIATAMASDTAFCGWGMKLFIIQAGYRVVYSVVMGALLAGWP